MAGPAGAQGGEEQKLIWVLLQDSPPFFPGLTFPMVHFLLTDESGLVLHLAPMPVSVKEA